MTLAHPRAALAARHPLKGAPLAARQSRFRGGLDWVHALPESPYAAVRVAYPARRLPTQGTAEPALPGRQCRPLGGDAAGGAGGATSRGAGGACYLMFNKVLSTWSCVLMVCALAW
jgi:hypothetical protein